MRSKEQAHDYRYFPEPDLLPLVVDEKWQAEIRASLPELPEARRQRMIAEYGITAGDAHALTLTKRWPTSSSPRRGAAKNPKRVANLVQSELIGRLKAKGLETRAVADFDGGVTASADLVESGAISGKMLKDLYDLCFERSQDFPAVYEEEGPPEQITDTSALEKTGRRVNRRESQAGGAISGRQEDHDRILRRPGNEGLEGSSQSAIGERSLDEKTGRLIISRRDAASPALPGKCSCRRRSPYFAAPKFFSTSSA